MRRFLILICLAALAARCAPVAPPAPHGAVPSERQLLWHALQYHAFIHFGPNTFTDIEWGHGNESPDVFNPTALDCRQWARVLRDAGMEGAVITAKHHDGFCLWPSKTTDYTVAATTWKDGKGDVLGDLAESCRKYGLKPGVYISPWDRNHAEYGREAYIEDFFAQWRETLTNYGEVFEVWPDVIPEAAVLAEGAVVAEAVVLLDAAVGFVS